MRFLLYRLNRKLVPLIFCSLTLAVQSTFITRGPSSPVELRGLFFVSERLPSYTPEPCSGPHTLEPWLAQFSMVPARRPHLHARQSVLIVFVLFIPGIVVMLFFQCMTALFTPGTRGEGLKWGLATYTMVTFSFVSIFTVVNALNVWFDDEDGTLPPGRLGYVIPDLMFLLNYWLADGLLVGSLFDVTLTRPGV